MGPAPVCQTVSYILRDIDASLTCTSLGILTSGGRSHAYYAVACSTELKIKRNGQ